MNPARSLTRKGERTAARMLRAATTVLARDGFGGATLGRIAEEAGADKRGVLYYYGTREALLVQVVRTVGAQIAAHIEAPPRPAAAPERLADGLIDAMWAGVTSVEELARAYFALIGGGAGAPEVEEALQEVKDAFRQAVLRRLQAVDPRWRMDAPDEFAVYVMAIMRGLLLEWVEGGETAEVRAGLARLKRAVIAEYALVAADAPAA